MHNTLFCITIFVAASSACTSTPDSNHDSTHSEDIGTDADLGIDMADASASDDVASEVPPTIFEPGRYNIGHRKWDMTYTSAVFGERTLKLSVWYPTLDEEGSPSAYFGGLRREGAFRDASVALTERAPLLVFSHGNSVIAEQSFYMTEFFASHGWVVAAPYHAGNTIAEADGTIQFEFSAVRPQDISATIDAMLDLPSDDPLAGLVSDKIVLAGHSFGGFTTLATTGAGFEVDALIARCAEAAPPVECKALNEEGAEALLRSGFLDERIAAAIPQAPVGNGLFGAAVAAVDIPSLLFTGVKDATLPREVEGDPIWAAMDGPHTRVDLLRGGHFTFSNICDYFPIPQALNDGCGEEFIAPNDAFQLVNAFSLGFAKFVLFGDEEGLDLLRGLDTRWATELELDHKPGSPFAP